MHVSFAKAVREMANSWGIDCKDKSEKESIEAVFAKMDKAAPVDLATGALLEIVHRINQFAEVFPSQKSSRSEKEPLIKPSNAKQFPGAKVGDVLYCCTDLEEGIGKDVVISVDAEDCVVVAYEIPADRLEAFSSRHWIYYATESYFATEAEALAHQAREDLAWHKPRYELAKRALKCAESGADLSEFRDGVEIEDGE